MSLFERLNNKRYDLQEKKKKLSSSASSGNNNSNNNISTDGKKLGRRNIKKAISDLEATQPGGETPKIETGRNIKINKKLSPTERDTINKNRQQFQDLQQNKDSGISQLDIKDNPNQKPIKVNRSKSGRGTVKMGNQLNIFTGKPELVRNTGKYTQKPKPNVTQTPVELSGPLFDQQPTKKGFKSFVKSPAYYARQRETTDAGRKRYDFVPDKQGKFDFNPETKKGNIEKYARRMLSRKQIDSKSNVPIKITPDDLVKAETDARSKYGGIDIKKARKKYTRNTPTQTFVNKTKQNRELQRQSRLNQRTITTNVKKNPGLSGFDKGQLDFDKNLEKLKSKKNTVYVDKTPSFGKEGSGMSFKDLQKQMNKNTKKSFIKTPDPIKIDPIKTNPLRKPFDPIKTPKVTKTLKALKTPKFLKNVKLPGKLRYAALAAVTAASVYNQVRNKNKTKTAEKEQKRLLGLPAFSKNKYGTEATRLSFGGENRSGSIPINKAGDFNYNPKTGKNYKTK